MSHLLHAIGSAVSDALLAVALTVAGDQLDVAVSCLGVVGGCWS